MSVAAPTPPPEALIVPGAAAREGNFVARNQNMLLAALFLTIAALLPFFLSEGGNVMNNMVLGAAYTVMALGLNIIVGYAGLLDLGYVAFFAIGAYTVGYFGSGFWDKAGGGEGIHFLVGEPASNLPGIHMNFFVILILAIAATTVAGMIIGLPTLRLRGDYIAIVTLAFGEIIGRIAINGDEIKLLGGTLTAGRQGVTPVDKIDLPLVDRLTSLNLRPWYWFALAMVALVLFVNFRLRDSRLGRAWIALREDEVAASSMGVPLVKTKLAAYGTGAAFGGMSGAFLASYLNTVNADQFQFSFSILILSMIILGGLGSIWGCVLGAIILSFINNYLIPEGNNWPQDWFGLNFELAEIAFGVFGFLLVFMMVLRPEGLLPERRRQVELTGGEAVATDEAVYEARMP
jgi:branched-chain amino acid transport system permease protein